MAIYDVDIPNKTAKNAISFHFRKHKDIKDGRLHYVISNSMT